MLGCIVHFHNNFFWIIWKKKRYIYLRYQTSKVHLKLPPKTSTWLKSIERNTSDSLLSTLVSIATHSLSMSFHSQSADSQKFTGHSLQDGLEIPLPALLHFTSWMKKRQKYFKMMITIHTRGGTNTKIPNTEHFEHWHTELRTFRTSPWDFETELRTWETEHRTFIRLGWAWSFGIFFHGTLFISTFFSNFKQ